MGNINFKIKDDDPIWDRCFFWYENENTIYPLAKEPGHSEFIFSIRATIFQKNLKNESAWQPESLCKYLKVGFFYERVILRLAKNYRLEYPSSFQNPKPGDSKLPSSRKRIYLWDSPWHVAQVQLEKSADSVKFLNYFKTGLAAFATDYSNYKRKIMVLLYNQKSKQLEAFIPKHQRLACKMAILELYHYILTDFKIVHPKDFTEKKLRVGIKKGLAKKENKSETEILNEVIDFLLEESEERGERFLKKLILSSIVTVDQDTRTKIEKLVERGGSLKYPFQEIW